MKLVSTDMRSADIDNLVSALQKGDLGVLNSEQLEYYNKVSVADDLMRDYQNHGKGKRVIAKMLMIKFNLRSEASAYKLINDAMYVFRSTNLLDKDYYKQLILDWQIHIFKLCMANPNRNFKHLNQAISNMIKIVGLDKADPEPLDPRLVGNNNYYMVVNTGGEQSLKVDLKQVHLIPLAERMKLMDDILSESTNVEFETIAVE
ncbi:MAG: hypothetical protein KA954_11470 [Chitinophagales bacterium]|nr:hypothetical protein [Chitinophagales bacterium]MBP9704642.1 hypothetical protein [Chitinophagales bacterium]